MVARRRAPSRPPAAAAEVLARSVEQGLADLGLGGTRVEIAVGRRPAGRDEPAVELDGDAVAFDASGIDVVVFRIAPNPGEPARPLARIASGGELSRVALAIKEVLADADETPTLVFDEVDTGIGGRSADPVGRGLWSLARRHQVLCVTHLPQIAAHADAHFRDRQARARRPNGHRGRAASTARAASWSSPRCSAAPPGARPPPRPPGAARPRRPVPPGSRRDRGPDVSDPRPPGRPRVRGRRAGDPGRAPPPDLEAAIGRSWRISVSSAASRRRRSRATAGTSPTSRRPRRRRRVGPTARRPRSTTWPACRRRGGADRPGAAPDQPPAAGGGAPGLLPLRAWRGPDRGRRCRAPRPAARAATPARHAHGRRGRAAPRGRRPRRNRIRRS